MSRTENNLKIAIDINVLPGVAGGIVQSTMGLVRSVGQLDGPEEYRLIAESAEHAEWIKQYASASQQIVVKQKFANHNGPANGHANGNGNGRLIKRLLKPAVNAARKVVGRLSPQASWPSVPVSDGYYESLGCHVLHFPTQWFALAAMPTIYNPHDLQHRHFPQFFSAQELALRETVYSAACRFSNTVAVGSEWIKQDVVKQYGVSAEKVQIIPWASPSQVYRDMPADHLERTKKKYQLDKPFMFYPAVTWPHKNHIRLFEAMAYLRDTRGQTVQLICSGAKYKEFHPQIEAAIEKYKLQDQVRFLGFLPEEDLRAIYRLSHFLILPTLFEADSCPIHEAWAEGTAVASANITALPDQVLDAGVLFDPMNIHSIADAIATLFRDEPLRRRLIERGRERVNDFDWTRTAKAYRAVYRRAANVTLSDEDRWLLQWDWMREPRRQPELQIA